MTMACVGASPLATIEWSSGSRGARAGRARGLVPRVEPETAPLNAFARLAGLVASNDRFLGELRALNARVESARAHLATNPSDPTLGRAYLDRARARRSRVLALLRANRIAAREFLDC